MPKKKKIELIWLWNIKLVKYYFKNTHDKNIGKVAKNYSFLMKWNFLKLLKKNIELKRNLINNNFGDKFNIIYKILIIISYF